MKSPYTLDLIAGLNEDLAQEYASVIRYRTFASAVRGPHRLTLRNMFEREIGDELSHAALLADALVALGATPSTRSADVARADRPAAMLRHALEAERGALGRYVVRRRQAEAAGEYGLAVALDAVVADETRHRDELQLVLSGWVDDSPREHDRQVALDSTTPAPVIARTGRGLADIGEDLLDDTSDDSFPASDPPSWVGMHAGAPRVGQGLRNGPQQRPL
jgi:bacterioferritin